MSGLHYIITQNILFSFSFQWCWLPHLSKSKLSLFFHFALCLSTEKCSLFWGLFGRNCCQHYNPRLLQWHSQHNQVYLLTNSFMYTWLFWESFIYFRIYPRQSRHHKKIEKLSMDAIGDGWFWKHWSPLVNMRAQGYSKYMDTHITVTEKLIQRHQ